jgi:hypothetical protein
MENKMSGIKLPTYKTLRDNQAYFRDGPVLNGGRTSQLVYLARFKSPNLEEVLNAISTGARINVQRRTNPSITARGLVDEALEMADPEYVDSIANNMDTELSEHLKRHFYEGIYQPDQKYLFLKSSYLPKGLVTSAEESIKQLERMSSPGSEIAFLRLMGIFNAIGAYKWTMRLRLDKNWGLPNIEDLRVLLKYETKDSSILSVGGDYRDYSEIEQHLIYLNESIPAGGITKIEDSTDQITDEFSCITLKTTLNCMGAKTAKRQRRPTIGQDLTSKPIAMPFPIVKKGKEDQFLN